MYMEALAEQLDRRKIARFIKEQTGKGPVAVKVAVTEEEIHITVIDGFTILEKALLTREKNRALVKEIRLALLKNWVLHLKEILAEYGKKITKVQVSVDVDNLWEKISIDYE